MHSAELVKKLTEQLFQGEKVPAMGHSSSQSFPQLYRSFQDYKLHS